MEMTLGVTLLKQMCAGLHHGKSCRSFTAI